MNKQKPPLRPSFSCTTPRRITSYRSYDDYPHPFREIMPAPAQIRDVCIKSNMYPSPYAEAFVAGKTCGNSRHAMFGLLKVLGGIFHVEDSTFKTARDACRGPKKGDSPLCTKSKGRGTGLNTACSLSHGFRLVKSTT